MYSASVCFCHGVEEVWEWIPVAFAREGGHVACRLITFRGFRDVGRSEQRPRLLSGVGPEKAVVQGVKNGGNSQVERRRLKRKRRARSPHSRGKAKRRHGFGLFSQLFF